MLVSCRVYCTARVSTTRATSASPDTAAGSLSAAATTTSSGVRISSQPSDFLQSPALSYIPLCSQSFFSPRMVSS